MIPDKDLLLGIDSSTTGCKAIVWNLEGHPAAEGKASTPYHSPQAGWYEQQADAWWQALVEAVRQVVGKVDANRILGMSIAHQRETFVAVDGEETRCARQSCGWTNELPACYRSCVCVLGRSGFTKSPGSLCSPI